MAEERRFSDFPSLSQEERIKILTKLASQFQPSDWWHMEALFQQKSTYRHFDIISALPIELSIQVLAFLPLQELFRSRRVSHRWNNILNSQDVCRGLLGKLFPKELREIRSNQQSEAHHATDYTNWKHLFEDTASRKHFFSRGEYVTYPKLDFDIFGSRYLEWRNFRCLYQNKVAICSESHGISKIQVFCLDDATKKTEFLIPNRESPHEYLLTSELLVVFTGTGHCHAFKLDDGSRKTIRMESAFILSLVAVANTIAAIFENTAIIWEPHTEKSWKIDISHTLRCANVVYHLDPTKMRLSQFLVGRDKSTIQQIQYAYGMGTGETWTKAHEGLNRSTLSALELEAGSSGLRQLLTVSTKYTTPGHGLAGSFLWKLPSSQTGVSIPGLSFDNIKNEWQVKQFTPAPKGLYLTLDGTNTVSFGENCAYFMSMGWDLRNHIGGVYLLEEDRCVYWDKQAWQRHETILVEAVSDRHVVIDRAESIPVQKESADNVGEAGLEVRRFLGIHERKKLDEKWK